MLNAMDRLAVANILKKENESLLFLSAYEKQKKTKPLLQYVVWSCG